MIAKFYVTYYDDDCGQDKEESGMVYGVTYADIAKNLVNIMA